MNKDIRITKDREALLQQLGDAVREFQRAADAMDDAACARLGINRTDARCMDVLDHRGRMTAGELAQASGLSTGAVTGVLDRLERLGYVRRLRDTEDRRRVLVEPTEEARRKVGELYGPLGEAGAPVVARYSDEELARMIEFLRAGTEIQVAHAARLQALRDD